MLKRTGPFLGLLRTGLSGEDIRVDRVSICTFVLASASVFVLVLASASVFIWMDRKDREECNATSDEAIRSARLVRKRPHLLRTRKNHTTAFRLFFSREVFLT